MRILKQIPANELQILTYVKKVKNAYQLLIFPNLNKYMNIENKKCKNDYLNYI